MRYLYLVRRYDPVGYDEYDSHVVLAESPQHAREVAADGPDVNGRKAPGDEGAAPWLDERRTTVELIGQPLAHLVEADPQLVLSSYNAG